MGVFYFLFFIVAYIVNASVFDTWILFVHAFMYEQTFVDVKVVCVCVCKYGLELSIGVLYM